MAVALRGWSDFPPLPSNTLNLSLSPSDVVPSVWKSSLESARLMSKEARRIGKEMMQSEGKIDFDSYLSDTYDDPPTEDPDDPPAQDPSKYDPWTGGRPDSPPPPKKLSVPMASPRS